MAGKKKPAGGGDKKPRRKKANRKPIVRPADDTAAHVPIPSKIPKSYVTWAKLMTWPLEALTERQRKEAIEYAEFSGALLGERRDDFDDETPDINLYIREVVRTCFKTYKVINDVEYGLWVTIADGVDPRQLTWSCAFVRARAKRLRLAKLKGESEPDDDDDDDDEDDDE